MLMLGAVDLCTGRHRGSRGETAGCHSLSMPMLSRPPMRGEDWTVSPLWPVNGLMTLFRTTHHSQIGQAHPEDQAE